MPQASPKLRAKFPGSSPEALALLDTNFNNRRGVIVPKQKGYVPSKRELEAIDYLFHEWDYEYDPQGS